jgi:hypothetical protein
MFACTDKSTDTAIDTSVVETPTTGGLALRFSIDEDYAALMDEPPAGTFYGSFWHGEDVGDLGPIEGREAISVMELEIDLPIDGSSTEVLWTEENLPVKEIYFLGFLDSDGNSDPDETGPDSKDPVTLPGDSDYDVIGGEITEITVNMAMLYP